MYSVGTFTQCSDTDTEILFNLDGNELFKMYTVSKDIYKLFTPLFWRLKFIKKYGIDLEENPKRKTRCVQNAQYRKAYIAMRSNDVKKKAMWAIEQGYSKVLNYILGPIEEILDIYTIAPTLSETLLFEALKYDNVKIVDILLNKCRKLKSYNSIVNEVLEIAAGSGNIYTIKILLDNGADIHDYNDAALEYAIENNHKRTIEYLVHRGATLPIYSLWFADSTTISTIKLLFDKKAIGPAHVNYNNSECLIIAARNGNTKLVKLFLDNGADIHAQNDRSLVEANDNVHLETVKLLIERGANIKILTWHSTLNRLLILCVFLICLFIYLLPASVPTESQKNVMVECERLGNNLITCGGEKIVKCEKITGVIMCGTEDNKVVNCFETNSELICSVSAILSGLIRMNAGYYGDCNV